MWIKSLLFDLNYNLLIGASLLAVAKSIIIIIIFIINRANGHSLGPCSIDVQIVVFKPLAH